VHKKQLLSYLRLAGKELGLLINFNEPLLRDGITRIINRPTVEGWLIDLIFPLKKSGQTNTSSL
jgi:hypothetical protein